MLLKLAGDSGTPTLISVERRASGETTAVALRMRLIAGDLGVDAMERRPGVGD